MQWQWAEETQPGDPCANMETDETLFTEIREGRRQLPVVRIYTWARDAVTVGRLQNWDEVEAAYPGRLLVRRPTGGFAVEHGGDLTISIATREEWLPADTPRGVMGSYKKISGALTAALNKSGVAATLGAETRARRTAHVVDCFAVSAACDIVEPGTGRKLLGAAQRREKGVLLQQMSLPKSSLRDIPAFIATLKEEFAYALGVSQWV